MVCFLALKKATKLELMLWLKRLQINFKAGCQQGIP